MFLKLRTFFFFFQAECYCILATVQCKRNICTGKLKNLCDLLYCDLRFIAVVWNCTVNRSRTCLYLSVFASLSPHLCLTQWLSLNSELPQPIPQFSPLASPSSFQMPLPPLRQVSVLLFLPPFSLPRSLHGGSSKLSLLPYPTPPPLQALGCPQRRCLNP